jgi:hypothetical protein
VPNELKRREPKESPLRMLVEAAAYGFAIRKVWPTLKDHWVEAVRWFEASPLQFPATLDTVTLVGVAPKEYWRQCLSRTKAGAFPPEALPSSKAGAFPPEAWPPFWELVDALGKWFKIHFVAVEGKWDDTKGPEIIGAQVLELRSLTLNPAADTSDSGTVGRTVMY